MAATAQAGMPGFESPVPMQKQAWQHTSVALATKEKGTQADPQAC